MAKREITVEILTETIVEQGIKAAKQLVAERQHEIEAGIRAADAAVSAAQADKQRLQQQQDMLQTLLIGALKRASQQEAIPLAQPAQRPAVGAGGKRAPAQAQADREAILAALPKNKADAVSAVELAARLGLPRQQVSIDLAKLGDLVGRQGERNSRVYWAK